MGIVLALVLAVLSLPMLLSPGVSGPSVRSRASDGLLGVRLVLEDWGTQVEILELGPSGDDGPDEAVAEGAESADSTGRTDREVDSSTVQAPQTTALLALEDVPLATSMVVAFPASRAVLPLSQELDSWIREGGKGLIAYSATPLAFEEIDFMADLDVTLGVSPSRGSIAPWKWWRRQRNGERFQLQADSQSDKTDQSGQGELEEPSPVNQDAAFGADQVQDDRVVVADRVALVPRLLGTDCEPMVGFGDQRPGDVMPLAVALRCVRDEGLLWVVPTSSLVNSRIENSGNLELLWRIRQDLGSEWAFLETPLVPSAAVDSTNVRSARATLTSMAVQLSLLYLGAVLALAWSFGPRWAEGRHPPDGHRDFLLSLGALHQKLGQFESAAQMLRSRWLEYDPMARRRGLSELAAGTFGEEEISEEQLVEWAQGASRRSADNNNPITQ